MAKEKPAKIEINKDTQPSVKPNAAFLKMMVDIGVKPSSGEVIKFQKSDSSSAGLDSAGKHVEQTNFRIPKIVRLIFTGVFLTTLNANSLNNSISPDIPQAIALKEPVIPKMTVSEELLRLNNPEIISDPIEVAKISLQALGKLTPQQISSYFTIRHFKLLSPAQIEVLNKDYLLHILPEVFVEHDLDLRRIRAILPDNSSTKYVNIWESRNFATKFYHIIGSPTLEQLEAKVKGKEIDYKFVSLFPRKNPFKPDVDVFFHGEATRKRFEREFAEMIPGSDKYFE